MTNNNGPIRKVSTLPATCTAVGGASSSNAVLYQGRVYQCTSTNTWSFAVGQTAALTSGRVPFVTTGGTLTDAATLLYATGSSPNFTITAANAAHVPLLVKGTTSQSGNLQQWQDVNANVLASVNNTGTILTPRLLTRDSGSSTIWQIQTSTPTSIWEWNVAGSGLDVYEYTNNRTWMRWLPSTHRFSIGSNMVFSWAQSSTANDTLDTGIARNAAGVLEVNNGTANTYRDIKLRAIESTGYAHADLPAANNGTILYCSDCTLASPCASGGTGAIAKRLNGAWVCN